MSLRFHRFQLRATAKVVNHMRQLADSCTRAMKTVSAPFRKVGKQISLEGPWVITLLVCTWVSVIPLFFYPYVKQFVLKDKRTLLEEERVRLCLQKGIDPYPYMNNKDHVYGNNFPGLAREDEYPLTDSWEHRAMLDFQRQKNLLMQESKGSENDTVERLLQLRDELRQQTQKNRTSVHEPKDLIFKPREGVNEL